MADTEHSRQFPAMALAAVVEPAHFPHIGHRQNGIDVALSCDGHSRPYTTSFPRHVSRIVSGRSDEQMGGTHTGAIVALMADKEAFRHRSKVHFPREPMCANGLAVHLKDAVAISPDALVVPAFTSLLDVVPEPLFWGSSSPSTGVGAWLATISCAPQTEQVRRRMEPISADCAIAGNAAGDHGYEIADTSAVVYDSEWLWRTDATDPATGAAWTPVAVNNVTVGPVVTV